VYDKILTNRLNTALHPRPLAFAPTVCDVELEMCPKPVADEVSNYGNAVFPVPLAGAVFSGCPMGNLDGMTGLALDPGGCIPWHLLEN